MKLEHESILEHIERYGGSSPREVPIRYRENMVRVRDLQPGIDSQLFTELLKNIDRIVKGEMVILAGTYGCGKTFAALCMIPLYCALKGKISETVETIPNGSGGFVQKPRISYKNAALFRTSHEIIKATFSEDDDEIFKTDKLLIVDDLGWEHFTDRGFGISEWDRFFDIRYRDLLPTIITTNLTRDEISRKYSLRIRDRLRECATWIQTPEESFR